LKFWATNHYAVVDAEACVACRLCETACQVDAINIDERKQQAVVNLDRCLGCGICVVNCPTDCLSLAKKVEETVPPPTREALNDIIMEKKKGAFGKILLTGNLVIDTLQAKRKP
jgi:formate hydrogenlyase subunit 6/NADH:ubiquinone oxidoreductase subunit I